MSVDSRCLRVFTSDLLSLSSDCAPCVVSFLPVQFCKVFVMSVKDSNERIHRSVHYKRRGEASTDCCDSSILHLPSVGFNRLMLSDTSDYP